MKKGAPYLRKRKLAKGQDAFYFIIPDHIFKEGLPFKQSTPLGSNENKAIQKAWELYNLLTDFKDAGFSTNPRSAKSIWQEYQQHHKWAKLAPRTQHEYKADFRAMSRVKNGDYELPDIPLDTFTKDTAEDLFESMKGGGIGARTCEKIIALLRLLFNFGSQRLNLFVGQNPFENLSIERLKPKREVIPHKVLMDIIAEARRIGLNGVALGLELNYYILQRPADLLRLHKDHVCINPEDGSYFFKITQNKTKMEVNLPVPNHLLDEVLSKTDFIIVNDASGRGQYDINTFQRKVKTIGESLGYKGIKNQKVRGSGSTRYMELGVPTNAIISLTGHTTENMLNKVYAQRTDGVSKVALRLRENAEKES